jgi:hypothetical protein
MTWTIHIEIPCPSTWISAVRQQGASCPPTRSIRCPSSTVGTPDHNELPLAFASFEPHHDRGPDRPTVR